MAWSQRDELTTPPVMTTNYAYLRLIGDRSIQDSNFGSIEKDRTNEMQNWAKIINRSKNFGHIKKVIVPANNHYAGFGAATANIFRKMIGLQEGAYYELGKPADDKQSSLFDFK